MPSKKEARHVGARHAREGYDQQPRVRGHRGRLRECRMRPACNAVASRFADAANASPPTTTANRPSSTGSRAKFACRVKFCLPLKRYHYSRDAPFKPAELLSSSYRTPSNNFLVNSAFSTCTSYLSKPISAATQKHTAPQETRQEPLVPSNLKSLNVSGAAWNQH